MKQFSIAYRLGMASLVFAVPVAYIVWALIAQQNIAIDFGSKEAAGTFYLRGLDEIQGALALSIAASQPLRVNPDAVADLEKAFGAGMESADLAKTAAAKLSAIKNNDDAAAISAASDALRALIARIGDKSNLILDPDLDSYYAMDLILIKLPDLTDRISAMSVLSRGVWEGGSIRQDKQVEYFVALGGIESLVQGVTASVASGYSGNPDGSLKQNLDRSYAAVMQALKAYRAALDQGPVDEKLASKTLAAIDEFYATSSSELERLLNVRVSGFEQQQITMLAITAVLIIAGVIMVMFIIRRTVISRLHLLTSSMSALANGDLSVTVDDQGRTDEVGAMFRAVAVFKESMVKARDLEAEQSAEHHQREVRTQKIEELTRGFEQQVSMILSKVSDATRQMQTTAQSMAGTAEETASRTTAVSNASEQTANNVQTVASAAEQLSSSVDEIARQVSVSSEIASNAVGESERIDALVKGLTEAAGRIGDVTSLINDIAAQTNLLALNATIEAARAGEAGRGFAVVASEVKALATQTGTATEEIRAQIAAMQSATDETVTAIGAISATIEKINNITTSIATAVEEQGAATQEIARNALHAANGTQDVSSNIRQVNSAADGTRSAAGDVLGASEQLSQHSGELATQVNAFLTAVRAA